MLGCFIIVIVGVTAIILILNYSYDNDSILNNDSLTNNNSINDSTNNNIIDIENWIEVNTEALDDLEKVAVCAQEVNVNISKLISDYITNAEECIILLNDTEFEECLNIQIAPIEEKFNNLSYNSQFRLCIETN